MVFLSWKQGKLSGMTKTTLAKEYRASWEERIVIRTKLEDDDDDERLTVTVTEGGKRTGRAELLLRRILGLGSGGVGSAATSGAAAMSTALGTGVRLEAALSPGRLSALARLLPVPSLVSSASASSSSSSSPSPSPSPPSPVPSAPSAPSPRALSLSSTSPLPPLRRAATEAALSTSPPSPKSSKDKKDKEKKDKDKEKEKQREEEKEEKEKEEKKEKKSGHRRARSRAGPEDAAVQHSLVPAALPDSSPPAASAASPPPSSATLNVPRAHGHRRAVSLAVAADVDLALAKQERELEAMRARQQAAADERFLLEHAVYLCEPVYSEGVPVTAYVLFRALMQWRGLDEGSGLAGTVAEAVEHTAGRARTAESGVYWLSSAAVLSHLLRELRAGADSRAVTELRRRLAAAAAAAAAAALRAAAPRLEPALPAPSASPPLLALAPLLAALAALLALFRASLFPSLASLLFRHLIRYVNARLLNTLLERRGLCRCGQGIELKMVISQLLEWLARSPLTEGARQELDAVRQACDVLVVAKQSLLEPAVRRQLCPALNHAQLYQLVAAYAPDEFDPNPVSPDVLRGIAALDRSSESALVELFVPVTLTPEDFAPAQPIDLSQIEVPAELTSRPGLEFLRSARKADAKQKW